MNTLIFAILLMFVSCTGSSNKTVSGSGIITSKIILDTCRSMESLAEHKNMDAFIEGKFIEYVPPHDSSKLGDEKIWDWELILPDNHKYPLIFKDLSHNVNRYKDKDVIVKGTVFYGIIFGEENTANMQGYRIDAEQIHLK